MKIAVQLYSIRLVSEENLERAFEIISEIGYQGVELALVPVTSDEKVIKGYMEKYNLEIPSSHVKIEDLTNNIERTIEFYKYLGCKRLIIPWAECKTKESLLDSIEKIKKIAPIVKENGMQLYYHNHSEEFLEIDGEVVIDTYANALPEDELWLEFDVCWITNAKADPIHYLEKYKNRLDIFHAKDILNGESCTLGQGEVKLAEVIAKVKELNLEWAVVESESKADADAQIEAIKTDYNELRKFL